jgi:CRP-like cAMP-binding protein
MSKRPAAGIPESPLHLKLRSYLPLRDDEQAFLAELEQNFTRHPARTDLLRQGEHQDKVWVLREGWAIRHKTLTDGRRQVISFVLPGDIIGIYSCLFDISDHSVTTLTPVEVASFSHELIVELFRRFPRLAAALAWTGAREESILAERLLSLGRRTALERTAHLLIELLHRLDVVNMAQNGHFVLPVTQEILADSLGMSLVHINRTLRRLRDSGLIEVSGQRLRVTDIAQLIAVGQFDDVYLHRVRASKRLEGSLAKAWSAPPGREAPSPSEE